MIVVLFSIMLTVYIVLDVFCVWFVRKGDTMTAQEVRQNVTDYVRSNELQDTNNKRSSWQIALLWFTWLIYCAHVVLLYVSNNNNNNSNSNTYL